MNLMDNLLLLRVIASAIDNLAYSGAWGILLAGIWLAYKPVWRVKLYSLLLTFAISLVGICSFRYGCLQLV